jgi:enoyl-CoA hydratase
MSPQIAYELRDSIATITLDDGKLNVLSPAMMEEVNGALDRAQADRAVALLRGRAGVFSAGFDLNVVRAGGTAAIDMFLAGFRLGERLLSFPAPVVIACTGHALAMGVFVLLGGDYRVGAAGSFKIGANEVAIGLTMPFFGCEMCRQRISPAYYGRAVINAEIFRPEEAVTAGFLDRVVPVEELDAAARAKAEELVKLDFDVHTTTKLRARAPTLEALRRAIDADEVIYRARPPQAG